MKTAWELLSNELDEFNEEREELRHLCDGNLNETLMTNRFLKNEVIELAEIIDDINH